MVWFSCVHHQLSSVNFLDLDIQLVRSQGSAELNLNIYSKSGKVYAYLPFDSYYAWHVFRGWLKADATTINAFEQPLGLPKGIS